MDIEGLKEAYQRESERASRLRKALVEQLETLLASNQVSLGVPLESRVKTWPSIEEKVRRKSLDLNAITELEDLVGIRLIVLFKSDLDAVDDILKGHFEIVRMEDTASRLTDVQFGYQSIHYVIRLNKTWRTVPTLLELGGLSIEIQVRTLAQHIWAAASHKLQYKHEQAVPPPLRRTIHRISALLETVDFEFERVLSERQDYLKAEGTSSSSSDQLNVDLIDITLSELLPPENRGDTESYDELLNELFQLDIRTAKQLRSLITRHIKAVLKAEGQYVDDEDTGGTSPGRRARGVYFTFTGLAREALRKQFGDDKYESVASDRRKAQNKSKRKKKKKK